MFIKKILVPTDFSESSTRALEAAVELAKRFESELCIIHVYPPMMSVYPEGHLAINDASHAELIKYLDKSLEGVQQEAEKLLGRKVKRDLLPGRDFEEIVGFSRDEGYDLIVIGSHGKGALSRFFLGSVTERVLRKSGGNVFVVRAPNAHSQE